MFKSLDRWLLPVLRHRGGVDRPRHLILAVCDHFEPLHDTDLAGALERLRQWRELYPKAIQGCADDDGILPRHTYFYPIEQNEPALLGELGRLADVSGGEVEVHLHHKDDTPAHLRAVLRKGLDELREEGFLGTDRDGQVRYGFIHGNWALDHSDPQGKNCGVPDELGILRETGCYADFTMPSAPHPTQVGIVNSIYYAKDTPEPCSHGTGVPVRKGGDSSARKSSGHLLCVQGPLALNWRRRKFGLMPRIENADLTKANPPTVMRAELWAKTGIQVEGSPEWVFVKLHTHGALPSNSSMFLGGAYRDYLQRLIAWCRGGDSPVGLHFVSAREMVNMIHAAEDGCTGNPGEFRDYLVGAPARGAQVVS